MKIPLHQVAATLVPRTLRPDVSKQRLSQEIAAFLLDAGRTGELESLVRDLIYYRARHGVVEIAAVSARKLSDTVLTDIHKQVQALFPDAKRVIITEELDPAVIGGVKLELVDRQLDLTVRSKLNHFKQLAISERTA